MTTTPTENPAPVTRARCQPGDLWQMGTHRLLCGDATKADEVARLMQGNKADLVFADPPYGCSIDAWDKPLEDVGAFIELVVSHLKQGGFFAFTQQMPYMVEWLHVLQSSTLRYKDHVTWIKRLVTGIALPLLRGHEELFIYSYGKARYSTTKGMYSDVKLPGLLFDVISIEGIDRYIKDLWRKAHGCKTARQENHGTGHLSYQYRPATSDRSPEFTNFTNVWSFLPEQQRTRNRANAGHATAKPVLLMQRLIELCTKPGAVILDPFAGSGTTLIAAHNTDRQCFCMELAPHYCDLILARYEALTGHIAQLLERIDLA